MKKIIILCSIIFLILCILAIMLKNGKSIYNIDLKTNISLPIDYEKIISVRIKKGKEGGYFYYKTENLEIIKKIYDALKNVKIGRKADINVVDDTTDYIFDLNDGTEKMFFFQNIFYYENHKTYETDNYKELEKIEIPETKSWE